MAKKKPSSTSGGSNPAARQTGGLDFRGRPVSPLEAARVQAIGVLNNHGVRELVESVVIAFVLAFLFKTFEAEAFVIPTGSMAPTLMGRHKDFDCPQCSYPYRVSASDEINQNTNQRQGEVFTGICPLCHFQAVVNPEAAEQAFRVTGLQPYNSGQLRVERDPQNPQLWQMVNQSALSEPSHSGDRIVVNKFAYDLADPRRWDVAVFRYPQDANKNYIKRLVGLPGEMLAIHRGEIYTLPHDALDDPQARMELARKPPHKIRAMAQIVYDNNYVVDAMTDRGWPPRWQPWPAGGSTGEDVSAGWTVLDGSRRFEIAGGDGAHWIRYRHLVPSFDDWERMLDPQAPPIDDNVRPELITDTYSFNSTGWMAYGNPPSFHSDLTWAGIHWVGDLMLEFDLEVREQGGAVLIDLVKGGLHFECRIEVDTGQATLSIDGDGHAFQDSQGRPITHPRADTALRGPGNYSLALANVDEQLVLWVDGQVTVFDGFPQGTVTYSDLPTTLPQSSPRAAGDLAPAGIGSEGAALEAGNIRLSRDVYYIAGTHATIRGFGGSTLSDYQRGPLTYIDETAGHGERGHHRWTDALIRDYHRRRQDFLSSPEQWADAMREMAEANYSLERFADAPHLDQFFAAGDNSPASSDSRYWDADPYFERQLLIGKAVFVYWPRPLTRPIPYFPNFPDMRRVR